VQLCCQYVSTKNFVWLKIPALRKKRSMSISLSDSGSLASRQSAHASKGSQRWSNAETDMKLVAEGSNGQEAVENSDCTVQSNVNGPADAGISMASSNIDIHNEVPRARIIV